MRTIPILLLVTLCLCKGPETGDWLLPGTVMHVAGGSYSVDPHLAGGGPCRGRVRKQGDSYMFFAHQCAPYSGSDEYGKPASGNFLECTVQDTLDDLFALSHLVCAEGKARYPSLSKPTPVGSIRTVEGVQVRTLRGTAATPATGTLFAGPSVSSKPVLLDDFNPLTHESSKTSNLRKGETLVCVAEVVTEDVVSGQKGKWYYVGGYDMYPSFGLTHYGWYFSSDALNCKIGRQ